MTSMTSLYLPSLTSRLSVSTFIMPLAYTANAANASGKLYFYVRGLQGMAKREPVKINLPAQVFEAWDFARRGYPHTLFSMACLSAFLTLPESERNSLMPIVSRVDETGEGWDRVEEWVQATIRGRARRDVLHDVIVAEKRTKTQPAPKDKRDRSRATGS